MNVPTQYVFRADPMYPDCDGKPMSDNTLQFQWIVVIKENLEALFKDREDVFVAGDLLWYAVEGDPKIRTAPDAMVAFGRPKGYRGSYKQWDEENVPPQVVFEILSPGNRAGPMSKKFRFYEHYGVEEYYVYDPDRLRLAGWLRRGDQLVKILEMNGWSSPRLGIRFLMDAEEGLTILRPDGVKFRTLSEADEDLDEMTRERDEERDRAEAERTRAERLAARLRELGIDPDS